VLSLRLAKHAPIDVYFVVLPDTLVLDWAGPAEALRIANQRLQQLGQTPRFLLHFVGPQTAALGSVGVQLQGLGPLPTQFATPAWVILLGQSGARINPQAPGVPETLHWLRQLAAQVPGLAAPRFISVCAGALLLAHAGLLRGQRVTTHHTHLEELREVEPHCEVLANRLFVQDKQVCSSAGVTTGIDMTIDLIAQTCSEAIAAFVAHNLVMTQRRQGKDSPSSAFLLHRQHLHPALHRLQDALSEAPLQAWDLPAMAEVACVTPRHLARLFAEYTQTSALHYLRALRLELAKKALAAGASVGQAAELAGFRSDLQLRRAWTAAKLDGTPSEYRVLE
jgi:transcriptional regulator GlxA family with amidase domain